MSPGLLLQMALLLMLGQGVLGALGYATRSLPWAGLLLTWGLVWFIMRMANVLRREIAQAQRRGVELIPGRLALFVAIVWQAPGWVGLPYWAPAWVTQVWQGAVVPIPGTLGLFVSGLADRVAPWVWLASLLEIVLFTWLITRPEPKLVRYMPKTVDRTAAASSDWVPARRRSEALRNRPPKPDPEPEE